MSPVAIDQVLTLRQSSTALQVAAIEAANGQLAVSRSRQVRVVAPTAGKGTWWRQMAWPAAAIGVVGVAVALFQPLKALHSEPVRVEQTKKGVAVNVSRPEPAATTSVVLPATIRPWQVTTLNSRVTGYLTAWHADLGSRIKKGDVLAELETPELDQEVAEAQAQAAEAVAAVVQAQAEQTEAEAALNSTVAELVKAKAEVELAKSLLGRREKLLASRSISEDEHETFQKQWEARQADVTAAES